MLSLLPAPLPLNQVLANIDDLFEREELSAAPDPGWPDCFNSGVFVYQPSVETYNQLLHLASEQGSFDGMYLFSLYLTSCEYLLGAALLWELLWFLVSGR